MGKKMKISQILEVAAAQGFVVTVARVTVNKKTAYVIEGQHGIYTKSGLIKFLGLGG